VLEKTDTKTLSRNKQFAFYVNAYNACTIKLILSGYPGIKSIKDLGSLFTICAATGILATAGYVCNEMFLYWFPNLGFSFCLLGLLLVINRIGHRFSETAQIGFVAKCIL
jgi:hypothetical protein